MSFTCTVGDSFYLTDYNDRHRCVVLTEPNDDGYVVLVSFTKVADHKECIVAFTPEDDKELFKLSTTIAYNYARLIDSTKLKECGENDYIYCQSSIVSKIIEGAFKSQRIPIGVLEELRTQYPERYENISLK